MKGTSKPRLPHLRPAHPHLRVRGWFLSENAAMPPGQQVKVHKSASFVDILEVCKFTTFCDRKGYYLIRWHIIIISIARKLIGFRQHALLTIKTTTINWIKER